MFFSALNCRLNVPETSDTKEEFDDFIRMNALYDLYIRSAYLRSIFLPFETIDNQRLKWSIPCVLIRMIAHRAPEELSPGLKKPLALKKPEKTIRILRPQGTRNDDANL